jgi:hypothetical protein
MAPPAFTVAKLLYYCSLSPLSIVSTLDGLLSSELCVGTSLFCFTRLPCSLKGALLSLSATAKRVLRAVLRLLGPPQRICFLVLSFLQEAAVLFTTALGLGSHVAKEANFSVKRLPLCHRLPQGLIQLLSRCSRSQ